MQRTLGLLLLVSASVFAGVSCPSFKSTSPQPYSWSILGGQLPTRLMLRPPMGTTSGSLSMAGAFTFIAQVADSAGKSASGTLSINIAAPAPPPHWTTGLW